MKLSRGKISKIKKAKKQSVIKGGKAKRRGTKNKTFRRKGGSNIRYKSIRRKSPKRRFRGGNPNNPLGQESAISQPLQNTQIPLPAPIQENLKQQPAPLDNPVQQPMPQQNIQIPQPAPLQENIAQLPVQQTTQIPLPMPQQTTQIPLPMPQQTTQIPLPEPLQDNIAQLPVPPDNMVQQLAQQNNSEQTTPDEPYPFPNIPVLQSSEKKKSQYFKSVTAFPKTLEETVIEQMVPLVRSAGPPGMAAPKPKLESDNNASPV